MIKKYKPVKVPKHWFENTWEDKAKENPLFAVMTTPNYTNSDTQEFTKEELDFFFEKGQRVWNNIVKKYVPECQTGAKSPLFVEYGCGMGRILKAIDDEGGRVAGIDISPTMLEHAKRFVPDAEGLYTLDENNRSEMQSSSADVVFSFAVLKHIHSLEVYDGAIREILRIMKPGAVLVLNVSTEDFIHGTFENPGHTVHFDDHTEHYLYGEEKPYRTRTYSTWSGIYISYDRVVKQLEDGGLTILDRFHHTQKKPQGIWIVARKEK